jgi:hypothetical protein
MTGHMSIVDLRSDFNVGEGAQYLWESLHHHRDHQSWSEVHGDFTTPIATPLLETEFVLPPHKFVGTGTYFKYTERADVFLYRLVIEFSVAEKQRVLWNVDRAVLPFSRVMHCFNSYQLSQ